MSILVYCFSAHQDACHLFKWADCYIAKVCSFSLRISVRAPVASCCTPVFMTELSIDVLGFSESKHQRFSIVLVGAFHLQMHSDI